VENTDFSLFKQFHVWGEQLQRCERRLYFGRRQHECVVWTDYFGGSACAACCCIGSLLVLGSNTTADDDFPGWSPKGYLIAFTSFRDGDFEIYTIRSDGAGIKRLTHDRGNILDCDAQIAGRHNIALTGDQGQAETPTPHRAVGSQAAQSAESAWVAMEATSSMHEMSFARCIAQIGSHPDDPRV
jgi:hypothetical protein